MKLLSDCNGSHLMMDMKSTISTLFSPEILLKVILLSVIILSRSLASVFFWDLVRKPPSNKGKESNESYWRIANVVTYVDFAMSINLWAKAIFLFGFDFSL